MRGWLVGCLISGLLGCLSPLWSYKVCDTDFFFVGSEAGRGVVIMEAKSSAL